MNNLLAFIPARGGSKSIPNKNLRLLLGKPLVSYSIETALELYLRTILNTDSEEIAKIGRELGVEVMMRPKELAEDKTSMFEVLKNEIPKIDPVPEIVLLLQPTSPFRDKNKVKLAISFFTNNLEKYDSLISVCRVPNEWHPSEIIVRTPQGLRMANGLPISQRMTRRQDYPEAYRPTGSIYLFKTKNLLEGNLYGARTMLFESEDNINLNTFEDWQLAENYLKQKNDWN